MCRLGTDDSSRIVWLKPHAAAYCRLRLFRRYVSGAFPGRDRHSKALQEPAWNVFYVFECACVLPDVYMRQLVNQDTREGISRLSQLFRQIHFIGGRASQCDCRGVAEIGVMISVVEDVDFYRLPIFEWQVL